VSALDAQTIWEQAVLASVVDGLPLRLDATIGVGGAERSVWLTIRWPDLRDELEMEALAARFAPPGSPDHAQYVAAARAMVEQLAVPPYPQWLSPALTGEEVQHRGKVSVRPNTARLPASGVMPALYGAFVRALNLMSDWPTDKLDRVAYSPRMLLRENAAQALGGVSPWDERVERLSRAQIELLVHLRFPPDRKAEQDARLEEDAKNLALRDEAIFGNLDELFGPDESQKDDTDYSRYFDPLGDSGGF